MTEPRLKACVIAVVVCVLTAAAARVDAQVIITSPSNFGTQSIGGLDGIGLSATGGTAPYTWTIVSGTLPPGLSIRTDLPSYLVGGSSSAVLAGVAITPGPWSFRIRVTDAAALTAEQDGTITISSLVLRNHWSLPDAFVGHAFSFQLSALRKNLVGGSDVVFPIWNVTTPMPAGMSIDTSTGVLSGSGATPSGFYSLSLSLTEGGDTVATSVHLSVFDITITTPGTLPNATQGAAYATTVSATGGTAPLTFAANGLPNGMSIDSAGTISGTTSQRGLFSATVTATDANHVSYSKRVSLAVVGVPKSLPAIAPSGNAFDDCTYGWPCSRTVTVSAGGTAPFTWAATGLPPGMEIRSAGAPDATPGYTPADAELWGNATLLGTYNVTVTVTDADGATATNTFPLKVSELLMSNGPNTIWTRGVFSSQTLRILGGPSKPNLFAPATDGSTLYTGALLPAAFGSQTGAPPAGVAFSPAPAFFSGTPTENVSTSTRLRFTSTAGSQVDTSYFFSVGGGSSTIQINGGSNLGTVSNNTFYSNPLSACCTPNALTWSVVGGALPAGLSLNSSSGVLSGNLPAGVTGTSTFLVQAMDSGNPANFGRHQFTMQVVANSITTNTTLPFGNVGTPYSVALMSAFPGAWSLNALSYLPPGLTLGSGGFLSGTPTASGQYSFNVTNANGPVVAGFTLSIYPAGAQPPMSFSLSNQGPFSFGVVRVTLTGATGGSGTGYHYSLTPGAPSVPGLRVQDGPPLPTGFSAGTTAFLMGVVTTPGVYSTSIRVTDSAFNFVDRPITVTVSPLQILSQFNLPKATNLVFYSLTLAPSGGTAYSWSATALPAGLTIDGNGTISGTPTAGAVSSSPQVTLTDLATSQSVNIGFSLTVNPFTITTGGVLPQATVGVAYSQTLAVSGCTGACTWSVTGGLPGGSPAFTLNSTTGVFSGTPTGTFNSSFTAQVSGSNGTVQKVFALQAVATSPQLLQITSPQAVSYVTVGTSLASQLLASGGVAPYTWTLDGGSLPPGVSLQGPGELLGGTLAPGFTYLAGRGVQTGAYNFTLRVTDFNGAFTTKAFTTTISALNNQYSNLPPTGGTITNGIPFTGALLVIGGSAVEGTGSYAWSNSSPLPFGLTLNPSTGVVSGTPTEQFNTSVSIQAVDTASLARHVFSVNFVVGGSTTVSFGAGPNLGVIQQGASFSQNLNLSGGTPPYTVTALTALPPGFSLLSGDALFAGAPANSVFLAGAPLASGVFTFTLQVQDSLGNTRLRTFSLSVARVTLGISTALPDGAVGEPYSHALLAFSDSGIVNWSMTPGFSLPPGLSLASGVLTGTPTVANNSYSFSLDATDPADPSGLIRSTTFSLRVSSIRITTPQVIPAIAIVGLPFSFNFTATGGAVTWGFSNSLPQGFALSAGGVLSVSEVASAGTFTLTVTATPSIGIPETRRFTLYSRFSNPTVLDFPLANTLLPDVTLGQLSTTTLTPSGGVPPYSWSVASGSALPAGLVLVQASSQGSPVTQTFVPGGAAIVGVARVAGQYTFDLIVADSVGAQARRTFSLKVSSIGMVSGTVKNGTAGAPYAQQFMPLGGTAPFTFTMSPVSLQQDMLPPGLAMSSLGLISGTPTSTGGYAFFLRAQDALGQTFSRRTTLTVANASGLFVSGVNPPDAPIGVGRRSITLSLSTLNGFAGSTYTWSVAAGSSLPPGLSLITGQPFVNSSGTTMLAGQPMASGTFVFALRATDNALASNWAEHTYTFRVAPMQLVAPATEAFIAPDLPVGQVGVAYSTTLKVAGGTPPYSFAASAFSPLPSGLTLDSSGVLSGTPQAIGNTGIVPVVTDSAGHVLNGQPVVLAVTSGGAAPLNFLTSAFLLDASVGVPYSFALDLMLRGGTAPFAWSVAPGSFLPPGLTLLPGSDGVSTYLGGVPTVPSASDASEFSLEAQDSMGQSVIVPFELFISPLALTPDTLAPGRVGVPYTATLASSGGTGPYTVVTYPLFDFPPGLTLGPSGVLQGTPTAAGNFPIILFMQDSAGNGVARLYRFAVDNALGEVPAVSLSPTPIQVFYTTGSPDPAPMPIAVNATSGTFPFGLSIAGIPGATLSAGTGLAPVAANLNWNLAGVGVGTYVGILGVRAQAANLIDQVPVTLTVSAPPPCSYSVNPESGSLPAAGGSRGFAASAGNGCTWTAIPDAPWITIDSASSGSGPATIDFTVSANTGLAARTGLIDVQGRTYSITQFGSSCSFAISPASLFAPAAGGSALVNIAASDAACGWNAAGLGASPSSGTGSGSVTVAIPPNLLGTQVVLNATIAGQTFTVTQGGVNCSVNLSPLEASSPAGGGSGSLFVTPISGCSYDTVVGPSWVSITSGGSGSAPGTLVYNAQPNSTTLPRSGALTIGGQPFQITQEGVACSVTVDTSGLGSPYGPSAGLVGTIGVTANGPNCSWVAGSGAAWATIAPNSGSGNGTIHVSVASNAAVTTPRLADVTVAGQILSVSQAGTTCTYGLQSATGSVPASGSLGSVGVVAPGVCGWTAVSNDPSWLSILSSGSAGTSDVLFSALANPGSSPRAGTLTVATKTYTVTQAAAACTYDLTPASNTVGPDGIPSATFPFSTPTAGCTPVAVSYSNWVTVVATSFGGGAGSVEYAVQRNPTASSRVGTIQVGDKTFTVTEQGGACGYSLNAYGSLFSHGGGTGSVLASATGLGCAPAVATDQPSFILLDSLSGSTTLFTLPFTVSPYTSLNVSVRFGKITFGGQIHTVKQTSW